MRVTRDWQKAQDFMGWGGGGVGPCVWAPRYSSAVRNRHVSCVVPQRGNGQRERCCSERSFHAQERWQWGGGGGVGWCGCAGKATCGRR